MKESIVWIFKKCSLSIALDGSEDHEINIEGIPNYEISKSFADESFRLMDDDNNDNERDSEENNFGSDNNKFDFIYDEEMTLVVE